MTWLGQNWFFALVFVAVIALHLFGHGGHGGHGQRGHEGRQQSRDDSDAAPDRGRTEPSGHAHHSSD